jgi:hypothetical protein
MLGGKIPGHIGYGAAIANITVATVGAGTGFALVWQALFAADLLDAWAPLVLLLGAVLHCLAAIHLMVGTPRDRSFAIRLQLAAACLLVFARTTLFDLERDFLEWWFRALPALTVLQWLLLWRVRLPELSAPEENDAHRLAGTERRGGQVAAGMADVRSEVRPPA